jgi:hypothetical protein
MSAPVGRNEQHVPEWIHDFFQRTSPAVFGLCLVLFLALGLLVGLALARRKVAGRAARSRKLGERGRKKALKLLRRYRFEVLDTEVTAPGLVQVDSRLEEYIVRADALVCRKRRTYVAEFKGGPASASLRDRATRRQLLEYSCVFGVDGVLLVDADAGRVHYVRFVSPAQQPQPAHQLA